MSGCTTACLKNAGTRPEIREIFIIDRTEGPTLSNTSFKTRGGIRSSGYKEGFKSEKTLLKWKREGKGYLR